MFLRYGVVKDSGTLMSQVRLVTRGITNFFTYSWRSLSQISEYPFDFASLRHLAVVTHYLILRVLSGISAEFRAQTVNSP